MSARNAYRILGHALALDCTAQRALYVYEYDPAEVECLTSPMAVGEFALRDEVSGGWKMRIGLGKVLLKDPNILLAPWDAGSP
jgi:ATPase subunit of ABC transporter with duplicated ATPase domains